MSPAPFARKGRNMKTDRVIEFEFDGREWWAYCPAAAIFDIYDHFNEGKVGDIVEVTGFDKHTREGWDAVCWLLAEFCRWGELNRRSLGETPSPMLTIARAQMASAADSNRLREIVAETLAAGFRRDVPDEEAAEVDLVLQEIEAARKKEPPRGLLGRLTSRRAPKY